MEIIFEVVIQIVFEVVCWAVAEVVAEIGLNSLEKITRTKTIGPVLRGFTYASVGVLLGIISYFVLPNYVFQNSAIRVAGIILATILMGLMACLFGWATLRRKLSLPFWSTEKFVHGVVFGASYFLSRGLAIG